jgi:hypothetical protein
MFWLWYNRGPLNGSVRASNESFKIEKEVAHDRNSNVQATQRRDFAE